MPQDKKQLISLKTILACIEGNPSAQYRLYDASANRLYNVIFRLMGNKQETEDVLQETYIKVFSKLDNYDVTKGNIISWMSRIAINTSINFLNRRRFKFDDIDVSIPAFHDNTSILDHLETDYILHLIEALPQQLKVIFVLYEIEGFSHDEISNLLAVNTNSCRVYLSRAKIKLKQMISDYNRSNIAQ